MLYIFSVALKVAATIFLALLPVVNPIGTALILSGMTSGTDPAVWKAMSWKIAAYSFLVLIFSTCWFADPAAVRDHDPGRAGFGRPGAGSDGLGDAERKFRGQ